MSWFKSIVDRLFGPEEEVEVKEHYEEQVEKNMESGRSLPRQDASFRFPIISDAEIYGWDEEPSYEKENYRSKVEIESSEDTYETVPLHENARWVKGPEIRNVYKAGDHPKYATLLPDDKSKPITFGIKPEKSVVPERQSVIKMSGKPFTPTQVPSPIHGLAPRVNAFKKVEVTATIDSSPLVEEESKPVNEKLESFEMENDSQFDESPTLTFIEGQDELQVEILSERIEQERMVHTTEKTDGSEGSFVNEQFGHESQPFIQPELEEDRSNLELPEIQQTKPVLVHQQEQNPEYEMVQPEDSSATLIQESEDGPVEKKERIVPFNVLMLKSDKAKMDLQPKKSNALEILAETENVVVQQESSNHFSRNAVIPVPTLDVEESLEDDFPYYAFPSMDYLIPPAEQIEDVEWLESQSEKLEEALSYFAVQATVIDAVQGPTVTRFELTVGHGTKVSKIRNLTDDLKLALAAEDIRIQAPIPGKSSIGIEIPNRKARPVRISEVIGTEQFQKSTSPLEAVLGLGLTGAPVTLDLRKMPHGMIAGATGSGKSVCINSILVSLLYKASPSDLKMMLIDPKMVELAPFNGIPHLISPVITDVKAATAALKWAVAEMERRYELLAHAGVRDIERYNKAVMESRRFSLKMPYLLIVIDELADLMMMAPADVEVSISRIAQKARACGIHLIIATQRPSVDVITGTIKANIPTRIAFSVSSQIDSRTIIDTPGAERLLGKGDMLYIGNGQSAGVRLQGTFVTDEEIERIIEHVQNEAKPAYLFGQDELLASTVEDEETDPLFDQACRFILEQGSASTSLLQRNFSIGYNRAAKLIDRMEKNGFISGQKGSKARDVFLTAGDLDRSTNHSE